MIAFYEINARALNHLPHLVEQWCPDGEKSGDEWVARNPTRNDKTRGSFKINLKTGVWSDFSTGENGKDPVSLYAYLFHSDEQGKAAKELAGIVGADPSNDNNLREYTKRESPTKQANDNKEPPLEVVPANMIDTAPDKFGKRVGTKYVNHPIIARWPYHNADGQLVGYACRYEYDQDGTTQKDVVCCRIIEGKWRWKSFPKPRPLYNMTALTEYPDSTVHIVEGEKTTDAAALLYPNDAVVSWPGGGKAVKHVDWSPLKGRKVVLHPDADAAGVGTMEGWLDRSGRLKEGVYQLISELAASVKICDPIEDAPDSWDLADHDNWTTDDAALHLIDRSRDPRPPNQPETTKEKKPDYLDDEIPPDLADYEPEEHFTLKYDDPFRYLGFGKNSSGTLTHYYMANGSNQVIALSASGHSKNNLLELAPLDFWERSCPGGRNGAPDWDMAINMMLQRSKRTGIYNPDMTRGRGAWWDAGRPVVHLGSRVLVGNDSYPVHEVPSKYIYEQALDLPVNLEDPLTAREAHQLVEICNKVTWDKPVNGTLLAGWIVCAIVCGALKWRPHIWITGGAGTGKTTVMNDIIKRCVSRMSVYVKGDTTKAGMQQYLQHDALSVIFDEAESERKAAAARIDEIMSMVTASSSEDEALTLKGSAGGKSISYKIRSCFAFSSIAINIKQHAARTRVTVLGMRKNLSPTSQSDYDKLCDLIDTVLTEKWTERLHARAIRLIPAIRHNSAVFSNAGAGVLGSKRLGDQIGALLAGAYALHSNGEITPEDAEQWIARQDWSEVQSIEEHNDESRCLAFITERVIRVQTLAGGLDRSIGELVMNAALLDNDRDIKPDEAQEALNRIGIRVHDLEKMLYISNSHTGIASLLRDTPWENSWGKTLKRIKDSVSPENPMRIGAGQGTQRATGIPLDIIRE